MEFKKVSISSLVLGLLIIFSIELKSQGVPSYVPTSGLVGWWPFTGNVIDSSGNGNNGTVLNGTTLTSNRFNNSNSAYEVDGVNCSVPKGISLPASISNTASYSISIWYKTLDSTKSDQTLFNSIPHQYIGVVFSYPYSGFSNKTCSFLGNGTWQIYGNTINWNTINLMNWHHIVVVKTTTEIKYYQDGNVVYQSVISSGINSGSLSAIVAGAISVNGGSQCYETFKGKLDDIGIWSRALTDCEIKQLYLSQYHAIPTLNIGSDTISVCKADSLKLTANNGFASYSWSTGATSKSIYKKTNGKIVITATDSFGCKAKDSAIVSILNPKIAPRDTVVCKGAQLTLRSTLNNNSTINNNCGFMPNALRSGMVGWYPFCGNANDGSGNGNNGTVNGPTLTADRSGIANSAYLFDGINDYIQTNGNGPTGTGITVSYWFKSSQTALNSSIIAFGGNSASSKFEVLHDFASTCPGPYIHGSFTQYSPGMSNSSNNGTWHHVIVVLPTNASSFNQTIFYVDGILISGSCMYQNYGAPAPSIGSGNTIKFGMLHTNMGANFYDGILDDIGIWSRMLSNAEIVQLYTIQSSPTKLTWSTSDTTSTTKVTTNSNTKVWLKATDGIGTCYDTTNVYVRSKTLDIGKDTIRSCKLDSLQLSGSNGFVSYAWSTGASSKSTYIKSTGKVVLTATDSFGCKSKDSAIVSILNPRIAPRDTVVCKGSQITLRSSLNNNTSTSNNACGYMPNALKSGLLAWYPFCGNANDASGNGNNGTINGASLTSDRNSNSNSSIFQSVNNSYIRTNGVINNVSNTFTISLWVNPSQADVLKAQGVTGTEGYGNMAVIHPPHGSNWGSSANNAGVGINVGNNQVQITEHTHLYTASPLVYQSTINGWHHLVLVYNNHVPKLYMDSSLVATGLQSSISNVRPGSGYCSSYPQSGFGNSFNPNGSPIGNFKGKYDDIGIWNRALSSSEIAQLFLLQYNKYESKLTWSTSDTTSITKITANSNTKVWLKATDGIGTCYDTTNVYVRNTTLDIGKDTIRSCKLDSLQLIGNNGFVTYAWSTGASSKSTFLKSSGKVVLTATDSFGCKAKDSAIVSVLNLKVAPRDTVVCKGAKVILRSTMNINSSTNSNCGYMSNALKTGLVAWYPFCGNANDVSGIGNNGTINSASLTTDRSGVSNSAYSFNGVNAKINLSSPFFGGGQINKFTVRSVVKIDSIKGANIWSKWKFWGEVAFQILPDSSIRFYWANSFSGNKYSLIFSDKGILKTNQWYDIEVVFENSKAQIFLNGNPIKTNLIWMAQGGSILSTTQIESSCDFGTISGTSSIGDWGSSNTDMFKGKIDDFAFWNRALSSTEITQLYTSVSSPTKLTWSTSDTTSTTKVTANANMKVWLKATDGIGTCYDTTNVYVSNPQLNVVNDTLKFTACNRDSLMLNVGSKWSSTQWSNGSKDSSIYLKTTGKYKVMVKDQYGCSASDSTYFINPGKPKIKTLLADSVNCFAGNDGSITSLYSGGFTPYTFLWNDASKQTSANAYNLSKGPYKLVLKDAYGCKDSLITNVYEPLKLNSSISFNDSVNCYGGNDGSLQVNVSGGVKNYQYIWNDTNQQNTAKASNLKQGTYNVVISDYYNCKDSITAVVSEPAKLQTSLVYADSVNCFGGNDGSIKINVVGGVKNYKFLWSDMQTTQNANNLKKGTYKVLVSDYYNCKDSVSVAINEPLKLQVSLLSNDSVNCFGGSDGNLKINVVGGVKNYKFLWSDNQTTQDAINLKKGTYKVMVSDYYNCKDSLISIIEEPAKLQVSLVSTDSVNCYAGNDGSININVVGGVKNYSFLWNDNQTTQNATGLKKGLYKVIVNDYYQCKDSLNASIFEPAKLVVSLLSVDSVNCFSGNDGSIQVNIIGGVKNYKTVWNDPNKQNTLKASNLKKGLYKVMVSDFYNCKDSLTVKVDEPAKLTASIVLVDSVNCFGGKDGKIQVSVAGGVKNYNYVWNDASKQKTALASNLQKGSYKVLVSDYYACKDSATASVMEPNKLIASINYVDSVNCFGGSDGSITTSISGGVKTYKYIWSDNQKTQNAYNLKKGNYKLIVSDYYNCKDSATATVYEPLKLVVSVVSTDSVNCYGGNDGSIKIKAVGGNNGYTYLWNDINKQKTPLASNLTKGLYKVSVKDIYGCSDSLTANVFEPAKVVLKIQSFRNASCFGYNDGSALASASGGTGAYKYSWNTSPVQSGNTAIGLRKGSYKATVLDAYGCSDTVSVVIAEPQQIVPKISGNRLAVRDILHELSSTVTPLQKYTYNWTPSSVFGKQSNASVINGKFYTTTLVTLRTTDATGCFGEDTATITVFIPFSDFIPTVFSPNGDSHNDVFGLPDYFEITQFDVYNRWGALLFRGSTSNPTWDGIYEGKLVPVGTYMYIIKAKLKNTVYEFEHQGTVTVLR